MTLGINKPPEQPRSPSDANRRHFLFVGGPFGPFFRQLAHLLKAEGAAVLHVNLHGGDWLDWGFRDAVTYRGRPDGWLAWLRALLDKHQITDIVTYGDCGLYSRTALAEAKERGLVRHVYELGYVRPHCITLDRNGVNGYSSLSADPVAYRQSDAPTAAQPKPFGLMMPYHVAYTISHCLAHYLAHPFFPHYNTSWPTSPLRQALGYLTRVTMDRVTRRRQRQAERDVIEGDAPFFLCALQKSGDSQIGEHSDFADVVHFINYVAASFAKHAPKEAKLVFKAHPLDYGIDPQEVAVREAGEHYKISDRLVFLPTGSLSSLMGAARGMVTVNSTAGLTAAIKQLPTIAVGRAFYRIEGLVSTGALDMFWNTPKRPDWTMTERFLAVALAKTQINGSYYAPKGREMALPIAVARMLARSPEDPDQNAGGPPPERPPAVAEASTLSYTGVAALGADAPSTGTRLA